MLDIKLQNIDKTIEKYSKRIERMEDSTKAMEVISIMGHKDVMDHFSQEQNPSGKWHPLSQSTLRAKSPKTGILKDKGLLRLSIRGKSFKNEAHLYTNTKYAKYHNDPDSVPSYGYLRKFLWISEMAKVKIIRFLLKFYTEV